jgi:glycerophosphoryl diester phosphodiesterase
VPGVSALNDRPRRPALRVGHKGAAHIEQGNTLAAFKAALRHDVDMLEFDVLPDGERLVLAHDLRDLEARRETVLTLEEALPFLAGTGLRLNCDLKTTGYEDRVAVALREHELLDRALISTMEVESLQHLRTHHPQITLGWSVPKATRDWMANPATKAVALGMVQVLRRKLPRITSEAIRRGEVDAVMAHWSVVTKRFVQAVEAVGGELFVWTVDDPQLIARMEALGVTGITTNDPRLFGPRA